MTWILIMTMMWGDAVFIRTVEFSSKEKCVIAAKEFHSMNQVGQPRKAVCVEK